MFRFAEETDDKKFDEFVSENNGTYVQCSLWPKVKQAWSSHKYFAEDGNGKRVFQCLILGRKLPGAGLIWYAPDGFICDYNDTALLEEFCIYIRSEMRKYRVTALLTDPHIPLRINHEYNREGLDAHKTLTENGFKLNHNVENYIYKSPVQYYIPLRDADSGERLTAEQIIHKCDKGIRYSVRIGEQRGLVHRIYSYDELKNNPSVMKDFMLVMGDTSGRNDFMTRSDNYNIHLMEVLKDYADISLVYYDKAADKALQDERDRQVAENNLKMEKCNEKQKKKLTNENEAINQQTENYLKRKQIADDFTDEERFVLAGGLTIRYNGIASCCFGGSRNVLRNETRPSHFVNYLRLKKSIELGCEIHDLGYVFADEVKHPENEDDHLAELEVREDFKGIRDFKASFNSDLIEFIGEYALVNNQTKFKIYSDFIPLARTVKAEILGKIRK